MLMAALSSNARAVIEEARDEMRPPAGERERLAALLDARLLGATALAPAAPAAPLPAARYTSGWRLVTSLSVGVALVGGAAVWALRPNTTQSSVPPQVVSAPVAIASTAAIAAPEPAVDSQALSGPEPARPPKPGVDLQGPAQRSQDRLAQEVALLSRATSDLRAGRAGAALKSLDEHQRKFPSGMLSVERRAVRAQALCALKRVNEGRAEISLLAPQSPAAGRAKQLCDAAAGSESPR
jgi:hypothetical protein